LSGCCRLAFSQCLGRQSRRCKVVLQRRRQRSKVLRPYRPAVDVEIRTDDHCREAVFPEEFRELAVKVCQSPAATRGEGDEARTKRLEKGPLACVDLRSGVEVESDDQEAEPGKVVEAASAAAIRDAAVRAEQAGRILRLPVP